MGETAGESQERLPLLVQLIYGTYQDKKTQEGKGLAHDSGSGAPCTNCGTECSGFDLHFWRKVCKNCGCRPQAHDITVNEAVHKEIVKELFNDSGRKVKGSGSGSGSVSGSGSQSDEEPSVEKRERELVSKSKVAASSIPEIRIETVDLDGDREKPKDEPKSKTSQSPNVRQKATVSSYFAPERKSVSSKVEKPCSINGATRDSSVSFQKASEQASIATEPKIPEPRSVGNEPKVHSDPKVAKQRNPEAVPEPPPRKESFIEVERQRRLLNQLPPQDFDPKFCSTLNRKQKQAMNKMSDIKKQAAGKGKLSDNDPNKHVCAGCNGEITSGEKGVSSTREKELIFWHEDCFKCNFCEEKIVDFIYFWHEDNIYCGRHFAEKFRPRCSACDELIYADKYTKAEGKAWHMEHFTCFICDKNLADTNYISHKGQPHCMTCYHFKIASKCGSCGLPIQVGEERISYENKHWHAYRECFFCRGCNKDLVDAGFLLVENTVYCSSKCSKRGLAS
ncbi:prickle planar cell polarity protein 3-like [Rhopilema esculentum]|uniref:prickle planar cell polarity protein 3-like n=1 Tax=Rhopilema esculentum TaxID=499914 RepID=UPI0031E212CB